MGTHLRDIRKKQTKLGDGKSVKGSKHRLTDKAIDKLQSYYGNAIRANVKPGKLTAQQQKEQMTVMLDYLHLRGHRPGPLFITMDGGPVSRAVFTEKLSQSIKFCGLDPSRNKGHSFRIGAASHAAERGMSDA